MTAAADAYTAAQKKIARAAEAGETALDFNKPAFRALDRLPPEIADLETLERLYLNRTQVTDLTAIARLQALQELWLNQTQVTDLAPIAGMQALQVLWLNGTQVSDLTPIAGLQALRQLYFNQTQITDLSPVAGMPDLFEVFATGSAVSDLRPLLDLPRLAEAGPAEVRFQNTPAARNDPELNRLADIDDYKDRTAQTLAYLRSLPPWPAPLAPIGQDRGDSDSSTAMEVDAPDGTGTAPVRDTIQIILQTAAASDAIASSASAQIRAALKDVPAPEGSNRFPKELQVFSDIADVLDRLASAIPHNAPGTADPDVAQLQAVIAELEARIEALTKQLAESEGRAKTAEALLTAWPAWTRYKMELAPKAGDVTAFCAKTGILGASVHFLGTHSPIGQALLRVLSGGGG